MKNVIVGLLSFALFSCTSEEEIESYPVCLQPEVDRILNTAPQNPRASIESYSYKNENVLVVRTNFQDDQIKVFNFKCELVCTFGGIDGNENDSCVDWETAQKIKTLWSDKR